MNFGRPTWAEIDLSAINHNIRQIKSLLKKDTFFCAVVKADAYGHGALPVAFEAEAVGVDYLAVATSEEAVQLRDGGITLPILVMGYTPATTAHLIVSKNITQTVFTLEQAQAFSAAAVAQKKKVKLHIKVDTGMSRIGVQAEEAADFCVAIKALPNVTLEGIFSHFASADGKDKTSPKDQFAAFTTILTAIKNKGITIPIKHTANSATTLDMPNMHLDMVRAGIVMYGLWPSTEVTRPVELRPAMRLKSKVSFVKQLPKGRQISYGGTYTLEKDSAIATLPIGYADGYTRMLSGKARVFVNNMHAPVRGRICMDQCMIDVTSISGVKEGTEVLLFGGPELPVEELSTHLNTINYEIICMMGRRIPRVYVRHT